MGDPTDTGHRTMLWCSKCGQAGHLGSRCPSFAHPRLDHSDARLVGPPPLPDAPPLSVGTHGEPFLPTTAGMWVAPADGHCLFHAIAKGLADREIWQGGNGINLRSYLSGWARDHPTAVMHERPLRDRIQEIYNTDLAGYAGWLRGCEWGGAPEIALMGHVLRIQIVVYERSGRRLRRVWGSHDGQRAPDVRASIPVFWSRRSTTT